MFLRLAEVGTDLRFHTRQGKGAVHEGLEACVGCRVSAAADSSEAGMSNGVAMNPKLTLDPNP